jgi:hypothetical protein
VTLCHKGKKTLVLDTDAAAAHFAHGDAAGACPEAERGHHGRGHRG